MSGSVLITGGAGFLGSHLADRFIAGNWRVIVVDNLLTGSIENIAHLIGRDNFYFVKYDVTKYLFFQEKIDLILHFACPASPVDFAMHPIHTMKVDSLGTLNSLGLAKAKKARYLFASTSEVYGSPLVHPQTETYWGNVNPLGIRSVYDEAKRFSESMCMAYLREHDLDIRIARIFNTYGTRMKFNDGRVIPNFIQQALENNDLTVFGEGLQSRSFCHVDDLVTGIYELATRENLAGEVVNLGNPQEISILELARMIIKTTESKSRIALKSLPKDDPPRRCPDITLARKTLDFNPQIDLETGLKTIMPWFRSRLP